jgi:hypothetical protein
VPVEWRNVAVIRDAAGIEDESAVQPVAVRPRALVVRGVLNLGRGETGELLNASGRVVAKLQSGANDIQRLPAGLYFVRRHADTQTQKVVILD